MVDKRASKSRRERRFPRKPIKTNVSYYYENRKLNKAYTGTGWTVNISANGALIRIENYVPPMSEIDLYITQAKGTRITTRSRVVHCHRVSFNTYEVGVQFVKVETSGGNS